MTTNWNLYTKRLQLNGTTPRTRQINSMKDAITNNFTNIPSSRQAYFNGSTTVTDIQVIDDEKTYIKKILMMPDDTIDIGDSIVFDSLTWLCVEVDTTNPVYQTGIVYQSTQTLNLYKNGILYNYPIVIDNNVRLYNMGYKDNKYISVPDANIIVYIKNDSITSLIERDEIFAISTDNYRVVDINRIVMDGLLVLKMEYSVENAETHVFAVNILNPTYYTYAYLNRGMIMDVNDGLAINVKSGDTLQLEVEVTDNNVVISPTPVISYLSSDTSVATVSSTGLVSMVSAGSAIISATCNEVSDTIKVCVVESDMDNYSYTISSVNVPDSEIKINQTKVYTAVKYNNGVAMTQSFTFSVTGDSSAYTLTVIDGDSCSIKCLKSGYSIVLNAVDDSDSSGTVSKTITLKPIF